MNLLTDPWIPVRPDGGTGPLQLLTYRQLLCAPDPGWRIALPRDDLELACLQLLGSLTQGKTVAADRPRRSDDQAFTRAARPETDQ